MRRTLTLGALATAGCLRLDTVRGCTFRSFFRLNDMFALNWMVCGGLREVVVCVEHGVAHAQQAHEEKKLVRDPLLRLDPPWLRLVCDSQACMTLKDVWLCARYLD